MRVLLVEPYLGGSHRAWAEGYVAHSEASVRVISHEARFWKWRMHGAHVTLAADVADLLATGWVPDVVLASSMLDLAAFLGMTRRHLGDVPVALYCHETQFTYPLSPLDRPDLTYPMVNWTSALAADRVFFNSDYHRTTFFEEVPRFLAQFPDRKHADRIPLVEDRSSVLPVGVDLARFDGVSEPEEDGPPLLLWNQRWEHDKGPDEFAALLDGLVSRGADFRVAVSGAQLVSAPRSFERLPDLLGDRLAWIGYADADTYVDLVGRAHVIVSTAHQEFFGIAIVEGMYAGAFPILPDRLVYPERIPDALHDVCLYGEAGPLEATIAALGRAAGGVPVPESLRAAVVGFDWSFLAPRYDEALALLASRG